MSERGLKKLKIVMALLAIFALIIVASLLNAPESSAKDRQQALPSPRAGHPAD